MADAPNRGPASPDVSRRRLTVGLLMCVVAIAFESMAVLTAMPAAAADLGDLDLYAWAFTLFVIAQTFSTVAAGQFSDRHGPIGPMIAGFAIFTGGLVLAGAAPTMPVLLLARFVQGLGGGTMNLAVMVLVARVFDERERAALMTGFSAAWMAPCLPGPADRSLARRHVVVALGLLVGAAAPGRRRPAGDRAASAGVARSAPGPAESPRRHLGFAAVVALGAALLQWSGQRIEPVSLLWAALGLGLLIRGLPPLMPRDFSWIGRGLSAVVSVRTLTSGAFFGGQTFLPLMLVQARQLSLFWAGATMTVGSVGWMLGAWLQSRSWLRLRRDTIITVGASRHRPGSGGCGRERLAPGQLARDRPPRLGPRRAGHGTVHGQHLTGGDAAVRDR